MANAAFTALLDDVYSITDRPDLIAETTLAVRTATLKLHQSDFYPKDLAEARVQFDVAGYFQTLAYRSLFSNFRAISYIRKYETGEPTQFLDIVSPTDVLDSYSIAKENIAYLAGASIQLRSNTAITEILFGYYTNPITAPDTFVSWVASEHPQAIVAEAAAQVFKMIGFDEQASMYKQLSGEQAMLLRNANIQAEGY